MDNKISIKKAAIINFASKYITIFIQIIYMSILARILSPNDFGIVAIIAVFTTFFTLFVDMGFGSAVIQNKSLSKEDLESIFSFCVYLGIGLALVFMLFSFPLSLIYENDLYKSLGVLLSVSLFFNTLNTVPNALMLKDKKFILLGKRLIIVSFVTSILTIILALIGFKYYALALNSVMMSFFTFIWNYKSSPIKFRFRFQKTSIDKIRNYSKFLFGFNIINYFSRNLDNLLIGKFWGNVPLANYNKSYQLMLYPVSNLTSVITPVLHTILSEHQTDKKFIYDRFLLAVKILSLLGVFISVYSFFAADEIILIVFGSKWQASVSSFRLLSLSIWAQMINGTSGSMFQVLEQTKLQFTRGIFVALTTITAILIGLSMGSIESVAICVAISYNLHFLSMLYFLVNVGFNQSWLSFCRKLLPDAVIMLIMVTAMNISKVLTIDNLLLSAFYKGIVCLFAYIIGLVITKQYKILVNTFFGKLGSRFMHSSSKDIA